MQLRWPLCLAIAALAAAPTRVAALDELPLKAAIVYNLLLFVQWSAEDQMAADGALRLCARSDAPLWPHLLALQARPVRQFRLELRDLAAGGASSSLPCQATVLEDRLVARGAPATATAVTAAQGLTIGDGSRADDSGVVIGLRPVAGRIGFDIDLGAARAQGVTLSSKVLRLARVVRE